ncbi:hypothetical protein C8R41DRAFT_749020 [Lentinula lateritia]|uniref:Arrestin-like N-terminal domain-containing protein n=1 Tax=Lentinula lateritia TaxID=40482 RepID=A0ABQ8VYA2_9AGAR|nr:hypothetical protein C8R41DRAFT_749020 [Lentinula lateritia]
MLASDVTVLRTLAKQLPSYDSISSLPPLYSSDPASGEQSIQLTPRTRSLGRPTGTYVHKAGDATVVLLDQEDGVSTPVYGRHAALSGIISLASCETVSEIKIKLDGHMDLVLSGGVSQSTTLVNDAHSLWKYNPEAVDAGSTRCPSEIPFTCVFPSKFKDNVGRESPLPPSMHVMYPGASGLVASCLYTLTIKIVKMGFWKQAKKLTIPLNYHPRTRAPSFPNPNPDLFSDVKISPDEWHQTMSVIKSRKPAVTPPVQCHLFIPSVRVFALSDVIHFHVQLTGPLSSLRQLVYSKPSKRSTEKFAPKIRVYLLRQITVDVCGQKGWKNLTLAEGTLRPRPPPIAASSSSPAHSAEDSLDWEGEIQCDDNETRGCPGFITTDLTVKDFIVLSISPPDVTKSDLSSTQVPIPIKLVTESAETWRDD